MAAIRGRVSGMNEKPLVILKTGRKIQSLATTPGDYEDWITTGMRWPAKQVRVIEVSAREPLPNPDAPAGVVITGSGAMVTEQAPWMRDTGAWLTRAVDAGVPVLGICFGHQLLAYALGGTVGYNPRGVEVGTVEVTLEDAAGDRLLGALPRRFPAQLSHRQSVLELPPGAKALGHSALEPHQAFAFGTRAWGVQFHPEFDAQVVARFVEYYRDILAQQGRSADDIRTRIRPAPETRQVLERFAALVRETGPPASAKASEIPEELHDEQPAQKP